MTVPNLVNYNLPPRQVSRQGRDGSERRVLLKPASLPIALTPLADGFRLDIGGQGFGTPCPGHSY